ncbi:MAG: UbiX family flavin prenyltransferase [Planctomycetaceae bacterium]|nr:UbiX family flavin prenyltransferase [Planctomycetaceae bacterium]
MTASPRTIVLGITGASGAPYAVRLLEQLLSAGMRVWLSISPAGATVIQQELGITLDLQRFDLAALVPHANDLPGEVTYFHFQDLMAPMASGSARTAAMVVCPCSGGTLSSIAHAASGNLIQRAADVHLKERRPLILVPRETPLSTPQLENMLRCSQFGATVLPAMPGYYHQPHTIADLVDFVVARILDQLQIEHRLSKRWNSAE